MKKDKKFLMDLENNLLDIKDKYKQEIISKYENIIKEQKAQNKKITAILKEIGPASEVAKKEIEALGSKAKVNFFDNVKKKYKEFSENREIKKEEKAKLKNEKEAAKRLNDKNIKISVNKREVKSLVTKDKEKKNKKEKITKKDVKPLIEKKENKETKEKKKKDYTKLKENLAKVKEFFVKERFVKKERKVTDEPKEIIEEVKEEFNDEVSQVSEIVAEKHLFESKEVRKKRITIRVLGLLLTIVLLFAWLWVCVLLIASMIAYLDGVKFRGIIIGLFGLTILMLWIVIMVNRSLFRKKMSVTVNLAVVITSIVLIALGIVLTLKQISEFKTVKDVSIKYSMTTKLNNYELPEDKQFILTFNSNYNTQYTMNYDDRIKDKVKIEVKYYECYYDYFIKETSNSAYISLKLDNRDRLSVYIDDLKEGLVFDNDELSRYSVKITINPDDMNRLVIQD